MEKQEIASYASLRVLTALKAKALFTGRKRGLGKDKPKRGNMAGLAKHLSHKYSEPGFFTKCMGDPLLEDYPDDVKKAICAKAHQIVTGIWPGAHGGADPNANEPERQHGG